MAYKAADIAKWFIEFNNRFVDSNDAELVTPLKLQKLLYYAQGAFLAIDDMPLFDEDIYAWTHGPVVPSVYYEYKHYGAEGIPSNGEDVPLDEHTYAMLFGIYEKYAKHSAWELRDMTHSETPYINAANGIIDKQSIRSHFRGVYSKWLDGTLFDSLPQEYVA